MHDALSGRVGLSAAVYDREDKLSKFLLDLLLSDKRLHRSIELLKRCLLLGVHVRWVDWYV
eukprot:scaffold11092_cov63-Phaeocystis_antarctica.AAC.2